VVLGDQGVAQHRAGDLAPAGALDSESELAILELQLPTELRQLSGQARLVSVVGPAFDL
jgi:hypothetical protein